MLQSKDPKQYVRDLERYNNRTSRDLDALGSIKLMVVMKVEIVVVVAVMLV